MVFQLSAKAIESRLANANKGNSIYILDGSLLTCGEFVLHSGTDSSNKQVNKKGNNSFDCGQIIDIRDLRDISKNERSECALPIRLGKGIGARRYAPIRVIIIKEGVKNSKLNAVEYNTMPKDLNEAIPTNEMTYIKVESVQSNAYLFHKDDIKEGKYYPGGIANAFLVRRQLQNPPSKKYQQLKAFDPFHNLKSYSKRQWDAKVAINEMSRQQLSRRGRVAARTEHLHLRGINVEVFDDIKHTAKFGFDGEFIEFPKSFKRAKKVMLPDLSNENKEVQHKSLLMRAIDQPAVKRLRSSLGSLFGIGNPTHVPNMTDIRKQINEAKKRHKKANNRGKLVLPNFANVPVQDTTIVRITTCLSEHKDLEANLDIPPLETQSSNLLDGDDEERKQLAKIERQKLSRRCPYPGLDMEYIVSDRGLIDLHFTIKCIKMKGSAGPVKAYTTRNTKRKRAMTPVQDDSDIVVLRILNVVSAEDVGDEEGAASPEHLLNQHNVYNNELFVIDSISENGGTVEMTRYSQRDAAPTTISTEEATHILLQATH